MLNLFSIFIFTPSPWKKPYSMIQFGKKSLAFNDFFNGMLQKNKRSNDACIWTGHSWAQNYGSPSYEN